MVSSVKENKERYTKREVRHVITAKRLSKLLGFPSKVYFESMVTYHCLEDCPVTVAVYMRTLDVYVVDLEAVKKKGRHKPGHVRTDIIIPVPDWILTIYCSVTLCMDNFF